MRLSSFLATKHTLSRRFAKSLIAAGKVSCGGVLVKSDIEVDALAEYEIIINKPDLSYNLSDYLINHTPPLLFLYKPPLMHTERHTPEDSLCLSDIVFPNYTLLSRLDYGVSGVVAALQDGVELKSQRKTYRAWVDGEFDRAGGSFWQIDASHRRKVRAFEVPNGAPMRFSVIRTDSGRSLIEIELESAARHQVRAVCAAIGFPIEDDYIYGHAREAGAIKLHCLSVSVNGITATAPSPLYI